MGGCGRRSSAPAHDGPVVIVVPLPILMAIVPGLVLAAWVLLAAAVTDAVDRREANRPVLLEIVPDAEPTGLSESEGLTWR